MENEILTIEAANGSRDGQRNFKLSGPLTLRTLFEFQAAVRAEQSPTVIIDLSQVPYMDSAGLGALVNAHISCVNSGRHLALIGVSDRVLTLFKLTRVDQAFAMYPTLDAAEKSFENPADA